MKHFFLKGSNNSGSVVFENAGFGEIKDHSIITTPLQELSSAIKVYVCAYLTSKGIFRSTS